MKLKFAHISDCHLGAWRNDQLNYLGYEAFEKAIQKSIEERVDFVIISGDLYDVSNPKVEVIDFATKNLYKLKEEGIPVYGIMGSHDFSPSDKSMIRPLISAKLFTNVSQGEKSDDNKLNLFFTEDEQTGIKLTGIRARKRSLEREDFEKLNRLALEKEKSPKIFVFHTMLSELKPKEYKDMKDTPSSYLPKNFIYYAGGHIHKTLPEKLREKKEIQLGENKVVYPGCLSPVNFKELEEFNYGGFCIVSGTIDDDENNKSDLIVQYIPIKTKVVITLTFNCDNKSIPQVNNIIKKQLEDTNVNDKIITIRIKGELSSGKSYDINSSEIIQSLKKRGAYEVLINKNALKSKEYLPIRVQVGKTNEEIEDILIHEHSQKIKIKDLSSDHIENKIHKVLEILGKERAEGAKVMEYENELIQNFEDIFEINNEEEGV
ncbi:MAG: DNA repair exonuclease [Promethearchaeota archaeon]|nr:MAG: DNA repair exonuclease [Candidatus Lokiarchaeota archaeon]